MFFLAIGEIEDVNSKKRAEGHITNFSKNMTDPFLSSLPKEGRAMLTSLMEDYTMGHKNTYAKNLVFDPTASNLSDLFFSLS